MMSLPKVEVWNDPGPMETMWKPRRFPWLLIVVPIVAIIGSVIVWRGTTLFGLPAIGEPFDLKARGTVEIPENENAFTFYRVAVSKLTGERSTAAGGKYVTWAQVNEQDRAWFRDNTEAMKTWLAGTTMERAVFIQPRDQETNATSLDLIQNLRVFAQLSQIAALRMEVQGDFEEAWTMYRASLRSSRHCAMHSGFIERLIAIAIYQHMISNIFAWSDHPNLDADLLRKALADLQAIEAMTPPIRENYEAEYFAFRKLFNDPGVTAWKIKEVVSGVKQENIPLRDRAAEAFWRLLKREPERSRRLLRLVWANWLAVSDLPKSERLRRRRDFGDTILFDPPAEAPEAVRTLTADKLNAWVDSTRLLKEVLPATSSLENMVGYETTARANLIVHIAKQLYIREHAKQPGKPEDLVPEYLKMLPEGYQVAPIK